MEEEEEEEDAPPNSPPRTEYELIRDNGFKHLLNTERDDIEAAEKLRKWRDQYGQNTPAEGGIIESITCVNFMCHEHLHVELGPLINFIVGENGSGKSAVLTALTLCLGGKASDTNRGGSLKTFVKEGCDRSFLQVKIKNAGPDAYLPDVYGESIIVERHFSKSGSSGFKILNVSKKLVSTKKQEIDEISEWYALKINNPLTILSQDNARQFLNSASPAQKYKYFLTGVQLEQLDNDYKMSRDTLDRTMVLQEDLNEKIELVRKEKDEAERLAETVRQNESLRARTTELRNQMVWCRVQEKEQELVDYRADLASRDDHITVLEGKCDAYTNALSEVETSISRSKEKLEALDNEKEQLADKVTSAEAHVATASKELRDVTIEERDAHLRLEGANQEVKLCESNIEKEERRLREAKGGARAEKESKHEQMSTEVEELNHKIEQFRKELPRLERHVEDANTSLLDQKKTIAAKGNAISDVKRRIRDLDKNTGSKYSGYDDKMVSLVNDIARDSGFESKPLGPIGAHTKLLKPEWSPLLERSIGDALNAFVVKSKRDQSRLSTLIRNKNMSRPPPVFIASGGGFDTGSQEPDTRFDTILRVLEFDSDVLRSQLIINNSIEKVILIKERTEAQRVMIDGGGPPRNVNACICFHDGKGKELEGLRVTNRNGTIGISPIRPSHLPPRMQSESGSQVAALKNHLEKLEREMTEIQEEKRIAENERRSCEEQVRKHRESIKGCDREVRHKEADIQVVLAELDAFEGDDNLLGDLRTELELKKAEAEQIGSQYGGIGLQKSDLATKMEEKKKILNDAKRVAEKHADVIVKANNKMQQKESYRQAAVAQKNEAFRNVENARLERSRAKEECDEKSKEVEEEIHRSREIAPHRIHVERGVKVATLKVQYDKLQGQIRERERRQGATDEQINDRAIELARRFENIQIQADDVEATIQALKSALDARLNLWRTYQAKISASVRTQFNYLLSERGFRGRIDLRHKERKIDIHIEPDETKKSSVGRDTKTLSGGEKSYSSICLLLSTWEAISSSIRCLDEFDVFMDSVNRGISTELLVKAARRSVSRQYIFITPNAMSHAKLGKDVKITR